MLKHLVSSSRFLRLRAAIALAGFTHAAIWTHTSKVSRAESEAFADARRHICERVREFAHTHCVRSNQPMSAPATLRDLVSAAVPSSSTGAYSADVSWAFSVMACLTVLSDGHVFTTPPLLKLVIRALQPARHHQWGPLRALHSLVWRCLVWSFARLSESATTSRIPQTEEEQDVREKAFAVIRQDGRRGVRSALVHALLGQSVNKAGTRFSSDASSDADVRKVISVVRDLITDKRKVYFSEGTALLQRLTSAIGSSSSGGTLSKYDQHHILPKLLLDGRLVDVELQHIEQVICVAPEFDPNDVRPLSEEEVDTHWDDLFGVWEEATKRAVDEGEELKLRASDF